MKVLHVFPALTIGGLWRHAQAMERSPRFDSEIVTLFPANQTIALRTLRSEVLQLDLSLAVLQDRAFGVEALSEVIAEYEPEIVHSHHLYSDIFALPAAKIHHITSLRTIHGITQRDPEDPSLALDKIRTVWSTKEIQTQLELDVYSDMNLFVSEELRRKALRAGFPPRKSRTVYFGVRLPGTKSASRRRNDVLRIGFVGRLEPIKNPLIIEKVNTRAAETKLALEWYIVGNGSLGEDLAGWLESQEAEIVWHQSTTTPEDVYMYLDVLLIPSYYEGLPITLLEAMSWGIVVIASDVGGIPEILTDGMNGFLVEPDDVETIVAILKTIKARPDLVERISRAAVETVKSGYLETQFLGRLVDSYRTILTS